MADIEPPSFSLGFDLDLVPELQPAPEAEPSASCCFSNTAQKRSSNGGASLRSNDGEEDDDFEMLPMGLGSQLPEPTPALKRLRRGPTSGPTRIRDFREEKFNAYNVDDDIEEFSSQNDLPTDNAAKRHYSVCSSSKFPSNGHGLLGLVASQSAKRLDERRKKGVWNASASPGTETISNNMGFPKLHVSPLRKFHLVETDSDEASHGEGPNEIVNRVDMPSKDDESASCKIGKTGEVKKTKAQVIMSPTDDLWKEICSEDGFHIPTPALDEVCEEYFRLVKDKNGYHTSEKGYYASSNLSNRDMQQIVTGPLHPAHRYYFHEDMRIQKLVRARLPHFLPLSSGKNQGLKQDSCTINYMSQFSHGEASKQGKKKDNIGPTSTRCQKNVTKSSVQDVQKESDSWINPRIPGKISKDTGKGKVHGVGKSSGHWYTAADGRRVYVAGNGLELNGRIAYRQYRRDSGAGFKRSNKKAAAAKKMRARKKK